MNSYENIDFKQSLINELISKGIAKKEELEKYQEEYSVLSAYLRSGQLNVNVYAESQPGDGFIAVNNTLEDFYFYSINQPQTV